MACLDIDWSSIDHTFVRDDFYESFHAPMWVDFTAPELPPDDDAWFCGRAGCVHEKRALPDLSTLIPRKNTELKEMTRSVDRQSPIRMAAVLANLAEKTASEAIGKPARCAVSVSVSSPLEMKARSPAKGTILQRSMVLQHGKKTPKAEGKYSNDTKFLAVKSPATSENENPNQAPPKSSSTTSKISNKVQQECASRNIKRSESKDAPRRAPKETSTTTSPSKREIHSVDKVVARAVKSSSNKNIPQGRILACKLVRRELFPNESDFSGAMKKLTITGEVAAQGLSGQLCRSSRWTVNNLHQAIISNLPTKKVLVVRGHRPGHTEEKPLVLRQPGGLAVVKSNCSPVLLTDSDCTLLADKCRPPSLVRVVNSDCTLSTLANEIVNNVSAEDEASSRQVIAGVQNVENASLNQNQQLPQLPPVNTEELKGGVVQLRQQQYSEVLNIEHKEEAQQKSNCIESTQALEQNQNEMVHSIPLLDGCGREGNSADHRRSSEILESFKDGQTRATALEMSAAKKEADKIIRESVEDLLKCLNLIPPESKISSLENIFDCPLPEASEKSANKGTGSHLDKDDLCKGSNDLSLASAVRYPCSKFLMEKIGGCNAALSRQKEAEEKQQKVESKRAINYKGKKRKSTELNFKANCSSKEHGKKTNKILDAGHAPPNPCFSTCSSSQLYPPCAKLHIATMSSCSGQHKKLRSTSVQPFKPFRLRTEERRALKEFILNPCSNRNEGIRTAAEVQFEEQEEVKKLRDQMVHHPLEMPSFDHPFKPQRSTKKLTVPKEPNFHPLRSRKTCTTHQLTSS